MELDSSQEQDRTYDNSEDKVRLDPDAVVDTEENSYESEGQNHFKSEDDIILAEHVSCRQVGADIYSQISTLSVNKC